MCIYCTRSECKSDVRVNVVSFIGIYRSETALPKEENCLFRLNKEINRGKMLHSLQSVAYVLSRGSTTATQRPFRGAAERKNLFKNENNVSRGTHLKYPIYRK